MADEPRKLQSLWRISLLVPLLATIRAISYLSKVEQALLKRLARGRGWRSHCVFSAGADFEFGSVWFREVEVSVEIGVYDIY